MRNRTAFVVLLSSLSILAAACGGGHTNPRPTATVTVTATPTEDTTAPSTTDVYPDTTAKVHAAVEYLQSPDRTRRFDFVPNAGILIAKALSVGRFGPVDRYDDWKKPLKHGETGWGGIATKDQKVFAWVWWNGDGSINFQKPITDISMAGTTEGSTSVRATGPGNGSDYWQVTRYINTGLIQVGDTYGIENDEAIHDGFMAPTDLNGLKTLDDSILHELKASLAAQFGANWNTQ